MYENDWKRHYTQKNHTGLTLKIEKTRNEEIENFETGAWFSVDFSIFPFSNH